jgi:hypothetical protein
MTTQTKLHSSRATETTATFGCLRWIKAQNLLLSRCCTLSAITEGPSLFFESNVDSG